MSNTGTETIQEKTIALIAKLCKRSPERIGVHDSLADTLHIDSIQFLELLAMLEEGFGFEIDVDDLHPDQFRSVLSVIRFVEKKVAP
ncbi:acyl carrier protein [Paenibacillus sp. HJGM_3]|uniref:acyl carrier protein n=1 Tax=Paenibacillus sp. HJGM_3 TaxID=3379816 RepID=UPI0038594683